MNDSIGRVGVNPVQTTACGHLTDVGGNRDGFAVIEENQMLVDVNPLTFHRVARDAGDGFTWSGFVTRARDTLPVDEWRKGQGGTGKQNTRAKSRHSETPDLDSGNLLPGGTRCKIGR